MSPSLKGRSRQISAVFQQITYILHSLGQCLAGSGHETRRLQQNQVSLWSDVSSVHTLRCISLGSEAYVCFTITQKKISTSSTGIAHQEINLPVVKRPLLVTDMTTAMVGAAPDVRRARALQELRISSEVSRRYLSDFRR
jgi:hypothetical protein